MRDTLAPDGVYIGLFLAAFLAIFAREIALALAALPRWWRWRFRRDRVTGITKREAERIGAAFDRIVRGCGPFDPATRSSEEHQGSRRVRPEAATVHHIDGNPRNNDLANLRIGRPSGTSVEIRTASGRVGTWTDVGPVVRIQADSAADALEVFLLGDLKAPRVVL